MDPNGEGLLAIEQDLLSSVAGWFSIGLDNPCAVETTVSTTVRFAQDTGVQVRCAVV